VTSYIESLGNKLAANSGLGPGSITFFVVRDPSINAFAAPGGMIGIHTGLVLASETESELAAVVAHELAHVSQRHMARTFEAAGQMQITNAVAMLAAILLGQYDSEVGKAAMATTLGGSAQQQINFIRANEEEADRIGIKILAASNFDPHGMADFFGRLQQSQRLYGDALPEFLRTHPVNTSRIASALDRASQMPPIQPRGQGDYRLVRMRLQVIDADADDELIDRFEVKVAAGDDLARYALALVQIERHEGRAALATLEPLLEREPDRPEYLAAKAQALAKAGKPDQALRLYHDALLVYPGHRALTLSYAQLLLDLGQPGEAQELLLAEVTAGRRLRAYYRLLGDASLALGDKVGAHRYRAEWLLLDGRTAEAGDELRKALEVADDRGYESARIAARLAEIERRLHTAAARNKKN
jgi:predicted Zn-dependent protease